MIKAAGLLDGYSRQELADSFNQPLGTIKNLAASLAFKQLQGCYESMNNDEEISIHTLSGRIWLGTF